ncbi:MULTISPECIES: lipase family protein [unclassified Pseudomonas]|uniref:lipase family protein n=1 Tax=unclassified Pseudomonas TaxID=196821 RepID=UPI002B229CAB|nr:MULTISPECIES: lipase family protein [unclassified Pseudomonas]MEA9975703.1 lipase family protein [Pseudomonas sp. RTS4]MEB0198904.1 lipase family protein [Pseudomonas sp. 5S4]MEB0245021.1 lipase family protein [Pseudomonas sp. 10S5]
MKGRDQYVPFFESKRLACPLRGQRISFQLVDEVGSGKTYAGLAYKIVDSVGQNYDGNLDAEGSAVLDGCYQGAVVLTLNEVCSESNGFYNKLMSREYYPLPITELQVRAEESRFVNNDGSRVEKNPAQVNADEFFHVEVRDLVEQAAHLPPLVTRARVPRLAHWRWPEAANGKEQERWGVILMPNKHTVLEVRPLRALRPILSTDNEFCALNLYQLALMSTLTYVGFGQNPSEKPVERVSFPFSPTPGNFFGDALASYKEIWRVNDDQTDAYYPLYEDVPYSKRFEVLPFNPKLYEQNLPEKGDKQEHPANQHFFDDTDLEEDTDTQAYITHHDEIIVIAVRGTQEAADMFRDADALQVPFEGGDERVHRGFYGAYLALRNFVNRYLSRFHFGQKVIICGHSLGGAIATLLAEALRRSKKYDVLLYTYGAPRVGDTAFVDSASELVHHRIVNHNDPVPSVPLPWMNVRREELIGLAVIPSGWVGIPTAMVRTSGDPYEHHGKQQHFMPIKLNDGEKSSVLWDPGCDSIEGAAICTYLQSQQTRQYDGGDMPKRDGLIQQLLESSDHRMVVSYIPFTWATLRRWQETQLAGQTVVTDREYRVIEKAITQLGDALKQKETHSYDLPRGLRSMAEIASLRDEIYRLNTTLERLKKLNASKLKLADVYGSAAQSENIEGSLKRWTAHKENVARVQLAMIPSRPDDVYIAGVYQDRDLDSRG